MYVFFDAIYGRDYNDMNQAIWLFHDGHQWCYKHWDGQRRRGKEFLLSLLYEHRLQLQWRQLDWVYMGFSAQIEVPQEKTTGFWLSHPIVKIS